MCSWQRDREVDFFFFFPVYIRCVCVGGRIADVLQSLCVLVLVCVSVSVCVCVCVCVCVWATSQSGESESSLAHAAPGLSVPCSPLLCSHPLFLSSPSPLILFHLRPLIRSLSTMGAKDMHAAPGYLVLCRVHASVCMVFFGGG